MLHRPPSGVPGSGSEKMAKVETLAFAVGLVITGFLTFVALPLA
jgi:hypothetical protein